MSDKAHYFWSYAAVCIVLIISVASCTAYTDTHRPVLTIARSANG